MSTPAPTTHPQSPMNQTVPPDGQRPDGSADAAPPVDPQQIEPLLLSLHVLHGRTRFPHRPVTRSRFLIGSDPACDLRLGGDGMPPLHSFILTAPNEVVIEAISADPPMMVNNRPATTATLQNGDRIRIGGVEFEALLVQHPLPGSAAAAELDSQNHGNVDAIAQTMSTPEEIAAMSAAEIVNHLAREIEGMEELQRRQSAGVRAMLQAAKAAGLNGLDVASGKPAAEPDLLSEGELDQLANTLTEIAADVQHRNNEEQKRDSAILSAMELLAEAQTQLLTQMQALSSHVASLQTPAKPGRNRAIA